MKSPSLRIGICTVLGLGLAAVLGGCGPGAEKLAPAPLALLPGSVSHDGKQLAVVANGQNMLRWQDGQWEPLTMARGTVTVITNPDGFMTFSPGGDKFVFPFLKDRGNRDLLMYFFDRAQSQSWGAVDVYMPLFPTPVATRFEGTVLQTICFLTVTGQRKVERLACDITRLAEEVATAWTGRPLVVATVRPSRPLDLPEGYVGAAFLSGEGPLVALVAQGEIVRWKVSQPEGLEPCLTAEMLAARGIKPDALAAGQVTLLQQGQDTPVYAAYRPAGLPGTPGPVLVWHIPVEGAPEFVGDTSTAVKDPVLEVAPAPEGKHWALLCGGPAAPGAQGTGAAGGKTLYLTGPGFTSPQPVDLQGRSPKDLVWAPREARLYFVLDDTEIWSVAPGETARQVAVAPPLMSLPEPPT